MYKRGDKDSGNEDGEKDKNDDGNDEDKKGDADKGSDAGSNRSESKDSKGSKGSKDGRAGRRRRRRRRTGGARRRRRGRGRSQSGSRSRSRSRSDQKKEDKEDDNRPMVEKAKGGVKLFVGRLPLEATRETLIAAFGEFGEVFEVFLIDTASRATTGARCAFVRIDAVKHAEAAIEDMHEKRILVPERRELGPIQVAFAKGEATRFGLDANREQLPARQWQGGAGKGGDALGAVATSDPDALPKEALVTLVKEGQRHGGKPFTMQWYTYCDSGKGGANDYDPKRHGQESLRQFYVASIPNWGSRPWFRRAAQWALLRNQRRGRSYSSSSSSSSSASKSKSRRKRLAPEQPARPPAPPDVGQPLVQGGVLPKHLPIADAAAPSGPGRFGGVSAGPNLGELLRSQAQPPPPELPPPPEPVPSKRLASVFERNAVLDAFLAKYRITPTTSFLMLKLSREQADSVLRDVNQFLAQVSRADEDAEDVVLAKLKSLGVRTTGTGGSWTSTERQTASPVRSQPRSTRAAAPNRSVRSLEGDDGLDAPLPSIEGLLGTLDKAPIDKPPVGQEPPPLPPSKGDPPPAPAGSEVAALKAGRESPAPADRPSEPDRILTAAPRLSPVRDNAQVGANLPPLAKGAGARVYVKNLDKGISEKELRHVFGRHGKIAEIDIPRDKESGQGKGYAFVHFTRASEAKRSIQALHFTKPWGRALIVERFKVEGEVSPSPERDEERSADEEKTKIVEDDGKSEKQKKADASKSRDGRSGSRAAAERRAAAGAAAERGAKQRERGVSSSGSDHSSGSSRWSKYTVKSKGKTKKKDRRRRRSSSHSYYSDQSDVSSRTRRKRDREREEEELLANAAAMGSMGPPPGMMPPHGMMPPGMGPPPGPGMMPPHGMPPHGMMPPGMMPPGMPPHMMPPPWAMPPWGMPPGMPPPGMGGFPGYDPEEAERQMRKEERRREESRREEKEREDKETAKEVWEDHPARLAQKRGDSSSRSGSRRRRSRSSSRRSSRSSRSRRGSDRKNRDREKDRSWEQFPKQAGGGAFGRPNGPFPGMPPPPGMRPPPGWPHPPPGHQPPPGMMPHGPPPFGMMHGAPPPFGMMHGAPPNGMAPPMMMTAHGPPPGMVTVPLQEASSRRREAAKPAAIASRKSAPESVDSDDSDDVDSEEINFADI